MKKAENNDNSDGLSNSSLALMVFSIGAILGAVISLIISRFNQVKSSFRRTQLPTLPELESRPGGRSLVLCEVSQYHYEVRH
jgi:hypothetical protein